MLPTPYILVMADEDTILEEAMDNLKEAGQRIRATQSLMRSQGMTDGENTSRQGVGGSFNPHSGDPSAWLTVVPP